MVDFRSAKALATLAGARSDHKPQREALTYSVVTWRDGKVVVLLGRIVMRNTWQLFVAQLAGFARSCPLRVDVS